MRPDVVENTTKLRSALERMGFVPVEEPSPRAGVFSHPETREYEFYLRFNEAEDVALTRLNTEKEEVKAILGSTSPSI